MIKKLNLKITNVIKNLIFFLFNIFNQNKTDKNLNKISKIMSNVNNSNGTFKLKKINDIFKESNADPLVCELVANYEITNDKNPEKSFKKMKKLNILKKEWINKNNLNYIKTEFIPEQQVMGTLGNHWPLFHYLRYKINIEESSEKPNLLLKENQKITNSALYNYFIPYLNVIQNNSLYYKLNHIYRIFKIPLEFTLPFKNNHYPWFASMNFINQSLKDIKNKKFDYFKICNADYEKGKRILKKIGLPDNAWYVTLHVRQGIYHEDRNSNPLTYVKAIKEIIRRGGYVFRVGDSSMSPLPKIEGLIDYPFTEYKSEFFDIFLAATCHFCIGSDSGYWSVPTFFGKPVLLTNFTIALIYYSLDERSLFLPKRFVDKSNNERVNIENTFSFPLGALSSKIGFDKNNIRIIDNSEDEIFESTIEMFDVLEGKKENKKFILANEEFKKKLNFINANKYEFPLKAMANIGSSYLT